MTNRSAWAYTYKFSGGALTCYCIGDGGLVDDDLGESSFESRVLLDIFAVLVQGGGSNDLELASGKHRFEQISSVHSAARVFAS